MKEPLVALPGPPPDWGATPRAADLPARITVATLLELALPVISNTGASSEMPPMGQWAAAAVPGDGKGPKRRKLDPRPEESDSSSDTDDVDTGGQPLDPSAEHCFLCKRVSGIGHLAAILHETATRTLAWDLTGARVFLRPRCGAQTDLSLDTYIVGADLPTHFEPCKRLGCRVSGREWGSRWG